MASKRNTFNFNLSGGKGLIEVLCGKGMMPSFTSIFAFLALLLFFLFAGGPFKMNLDTLLFKFILLLMLSYISFLFLKTTIEIVVEKDNIQFRTFQRYRKFPFSRIRLIKIYYFWTALMSTIIIKTKDKSTRYYLWAPPFGERYDLFSKLVETLKKKSKGNFEFRYKR